MADNYGGIGLFGAGLGFLAGIVASQEVFISTSVFRVDRLVYGLVFVV